MPSDYSDHPIFRLRYILLMSAIIGMILVVLASANVMSSLDGVFSAEGVLLLLSGLVACWDLTSYKTQKTSHPDEDPKWPDKRIMYSDLVLALVLQYLFWYMIISLSWTYSYHNYLLETYATLPPVVSS